MSGVRAFRQTDRRERAMTMTADCTLTKLSDHTCI
jgi:hypothetical protein